MRSTFGGTSVDWLLKPYKIGNSTLVALRDGTTVLTFHTAITGGSQHTDLLDQLGSPADRITVTGYQLPSFQGPDGVLAMWADKGDGSPRERVEAQDLAAAASAVAAAQDARDDAVAATATKVNKGELVFNVRDYTAAGDGVTDDTAAILAAVAAAKAAASNRGAVVFFPAGSYLISAPIVLPRTGATPANVVTLRGASVRSAQLLGSGSFSTNRGMVEWEATTDKAWHQEITDLSFRLPNVSGVRAVWYKKNSAGTTLADFNAERMQITLRDLLLEGNNGYHASLVKLEGQVFYSKFERVFGDNQLSVLLGATVYSPVTDVDTATFELDSNLYGDLVSSDIVGLSYSSIIRCGGASLRRGGRGVLVRGKLKASSISDSWCDGGRYDAGIDLINSFNVHLVNCNNEGRSATQIRVKDSQFVTLDKIAPSSQDPEFPDWAASTAYTTAWGVVVPGWRSATTGTPANANWYKCTVAGTSGSSQPTWPTVVGNTVTDGTVTWQCMGPAVNDAVVVDGGKHIFLDRIATGPSLPNFSARGCKMLRLLNAPVGVTAKRCVAPDDPTLEVAWLDSAGVGDFYGNRNGERVRVGADPYDPKTWRVNPGYYRGPRGTTGTTRTMTQNSEYAVPIDVPAGTVIDRIGINVTTAAASGVVRLGLRADTGNGYPGALLVDAGTIDASTAGTKEVTVSVTTSGARVWAVAVGQGAASIVCTGINGPVWPVEGFATLAAAAPGVQAAYVQTGVTGALGAFAASQGASGSAPYVVVRTAS